MTDPILSAVTPAPPGTTMLLAEVNKLKSISPVIFEIIRSPDTVLSLSFDGSPSAKLVAPSIVNLASTKAKLANDNELPVGEYVLDMSTCFNTVANLSVTAVILGKYVASVKAASS